MLVFSRDVAEKYTDKEENTMRTIIAPYRKNKKIDTLQLAKETLMNFYPIGKLFIVLSTTELNHVNIEYLSLYNRQSNVYLVINEEFIVDLFESEKRIVKDIRIFGICNLNQEKCIDIENILNRKKFHSNRDLVGMVDIFFYSENFFETITLLENECIIL